MPSNAPRGRRPFWLIVLCLAALPGLSPRAGVAAPAGQPAGLSMSVRAGYDGRYKIGEWFPVQVTLNNTGAALDAEVRVDAPGDNGNTLGTYARQVSLPSPAHKIITLYTYATSYQHQIVVQLRRESTVVAEQKVTVEPLSSGFLFGVVSDTPDLLNALSGTRLGAGTADPATVVHLAPEDLPPAAAALFGLDALIFANTDTSRLSAETRQALEGWVAAGGTLIAAGGATAQATTAGLETMLPAAITGSGPVPDLAPLAAYVGAAAPPVGVGLVSTLRLHPERDAVSPLAGAGSPLLTYRPLGSGEVYLLALDPATPPLLTWDKTTALWQHLVANHQTGLSGGAARRTGNTSNLPGSIGSNYYLNQLSPFDMPALELPSIAAVGAFLFLYVIVVGPVNYFVLRRLGRNELAWLTIPATILVFAVFAYLLGYSSKGSQLRFTTGTIISTYPGASVANVNSFAGVFSPSRRSYSVEYAADAQIAEVSPGGSGGPTTGSRPVIYQDRPSRISGLNVDTWSLRGFLGETTLSYTAPLTGALRTDGTVVTGQITNHGNTPLQDVAVVVGNEVQHLGALPAGGSATVRLPTSEIPTNIPPDVEKVLTALVPGVQLQAYPPPNSDADRLARRRAALILTAASSNRRLPGAGAAWIIAWAPASPLSVAVPGEQPVRDDVVLINAQVPVATAAGAGAAKPQPLARTVAEGSVQESGGTGSHRLLINGAATFQYQVPAGLRAGRLMIDYSVGTSSGPLGLQLLNWQTGVWEDAQALGGQQIASGTSFSGGIGNSARYISPAGLVRLRVIPDPAQSTALAYLNRLDLTAEVVP